jgi:plastocyanin
MQFSTSKLLSLISSVLSIAASQTPLLIEVGRNGLTFSPPTANVSVGGQVTFKFPETHSVAQRNFATPCAPLSVESFFSGGFVTTNPNGNATAFTITVKDTNPIYYYYVFPSHYRNRIVSIINPT